MKELNKRIAIDFLASPATMVPLLIGVSLLMLSPVAGSGWGLVGFLSCLGGVGMLATNFVLNYDKISTKVINDMQEEQRVARDMKLDELDAVLASNKEPRDQTALRNMRTLYDDFVADLKAGRISAIGSSAMFDQIKTLFDCCVSRLERQHQIWLTSCKVNGDIKKGLIKQRDEMLDEVEHSVESMATVISEVRALGLKASKGELAELSEKLTRQLDVAKQTDATLNAIGEDDILARYAEYQK